MSMRARILMFLAATGLLIAALALSSPADAAPSISLIAGTLELPIH